MLFVTTCYQMGEIMKRKVNLTYQMVGEYCSQLIQKGEKPNIRKLHQQLGGSFSTLSVLHQQWLTAQNLTTRTDTPLSEQFQKALFAEFGRVTGDIRQNLETQLAEEKTRFQEAQDLLKELELKLEQITEEYTQYRKEEAEHKLQFEKTLSATQALLVEKEKHERSLSDQLEKLRERSHEAELNTAIWETRHQESEKQNQQLRQEIKKLKEGVF